MLDVVLRRRPSRNRLRSSVTRWVGWLEAMEDRLLLSGNGLIDQTTGTPIPAAFGGGSTGFPQHTFVVTGVPQDASNTGAVTTQNIEIDGHVTGPFLSQNFLNTHEHLQIDYSINGGSFTMGVVWPDTTQPGPANFHQDPSVINQVDFQIPVTLLNVGTLQSLNFQITSQYGSLEAFQASGTPPVITTTPLTGTFTYTAPTTLTSITGITTPRNTAVPDSTAIVTFSSAIDPTTFTTANLTLTKNGTAVTPLTNVTIVATDSTNTTFYVNGLSGYTTPPVQPTPPDLTPVGPDSYVLTVDATGIKAADQTPVTGSQSSSFVIDTIPPQIVPFSPLPKSENPVPDNTVVATFTKPIDPSTFTPATLSLTGSTVSGFPAGVTIVPKDSTNTAFYINGLSMYTPTQTPGTPDTSYRLTVNGRGHQGPGGQLANCQPESQLRDRRITVCLLDRRPRAELLCGAVDQHHVLRPDQRDDPRILGPHPVPER